MVEARIDLPKNYDPDMDGPIEFVRMCASGDPGAAALRLQALETCKTLRQRHSDEPAVYHLSGLVCYINDNEEAALRFWGQALHCMPNTILPGAPWKSIWRLTDIGRAYRPICREYLKAKTSFLMNISSWYVSTLTPATWCKPTITPSGRRRTTGRKCRNYGIFEHAVKRQADWPRRAT